LSFVRRFPLAALLVLSPLALSAGPQCRYIPADDPSRLPCEIQTAASAPAGPRATLRVATFNVHYGDDVPALAAAIGASDSLKDADILLLQEIESYPAQARARDLARRLGMHVVYAPARPKRDGTHGLAILSRYPVSDVEIVRLPQFELGWGTRRRIALTATVDWNDTPVHVANAHLDTRLTLAQRRAQIQPVLEQAARHERAVVGGDMNTISCLEALLPGVPVLLPGLSQGPAFDQFMRAQGFSAPFHSIGWTGPLRQRLDGLFLRGLGAAAVGKDTAVDVSDHLPLWADVVL
jgi:endonuclease/exonuclease/phosphatase family metal-dependent hydrolase